ncbi:UDP-N-acetylmuramoyl-tripeptide--D-alanyl-D-alanine ligase [Bacteroidia bacterium]|nr:UDP-N-acetylmuramoyl-tripeptide--D-alanyl-D-alanine ligase [Bacteroidia bacterium]
MPIADLHNRFLNSAGICTDTRKIVAGAMFFALRGDNFNGNQFARAALDAGASCVVVDEAPANDDNRYIVVDDVLQTLQQLAAFHRQYLNIPIVAITGTNGKTTTKELVFGVLSKKYATAATQGNLNNHIGVPLTLLGMDKRTELGVVEMGANHPGEIAALCNIAQPNAGLITNVGKAHLEGFGSFDGVKKTKGELYDYLVQHNGQIFAHSENPHLMQMLHDRNASHNTLYGERTLHTCILTANEQSPYFCFTHNGTPITTHLVGNYNAANVWAAMAVGNYFGIPENEVLDAISCYQPTNCRSQWVETAHNHLIVDAYNANPTSMATAIENFKSLAATNKCLILGEMLELGADSEQEHRNIIQQVEKAGFERVLFVGKHFAALPKPKQYIDFDNVDELIAYIAQHPLQQQTMIIKGSHGVHLERVVPLL